MKLMKFRHPTQSVIGHFEYQRNLEMWQSQPKSASVGCGFYVQNPSDADADLSCNQISTSYYSYCDAT